jgi:hypothetical protein
MYWYHFCIPFGPHSLRLLFLLRRGFFGGCPTVPRPASETGRIKPETLAVPRDRGDGWTSSQEVLTMARSQQRPRFH